MRTGVEDASEECDTRRNDIVSAHVVPLETPSASHMVDHDNDR